MGIGIVNVFDMTAHNVVDNVAKEHAQMLERVAIGRDTFKVLLVIDSTIGGAFRVNGGRDKFVGSRQGQEIIGFNDPFNGREESHDSHTDDDRLLIDDAIPGEETQQSREDTTDDKWPRSCNGVYSRCEEDVDDGCWDDGKDTGVHRIDQIELEILDE